MTELILSDGLGDTCRVAHPVADPIGQFRGQGGHHDECIGFGVLHVLLMLSFDDDVVYNGMLRNGSQACLLPKLNELGIIKWAVLVPCLWPVWGEGCRFAQGLGQLACDRDR